MQAVLRGDEPVQVDTDDFQYVVDLGLVKRTSGGAEAAKPLYREVLARRLSLNVQANLPVPWWFWASADGRLDFAAGRGAMGLLVDYGPDRFALEIKRVRARDALDTLVARGLTQLGAYLGTVGLEHSWLVVFDVRPDRSWDDRRWTREETTRDGKRVVVLGA